MGAGPAGSVTAATLAPESSGLRTLLVDRKEKVGLPLSCGEALPTYSDLVRFIPALGDLDARDLFDFPTPVVAGPIAAMDFLSPSGRRFRADLQGIMIDREQMDRHYADLAVARGAELRLSTKVLSIRDAHFPNAVGSPGFEIVTDRGSFRSKIVVGADGPLSMVSRSDPRFPDNRDLARCSFVLAEGEFPEEEIELHFRRTYRGGYFWYFPKRGRANIGLGIRGRALTKPLLQAELSRIARSRALRVLVWGGGIVPLSGLKKRLAVPGKALVGDAAGMVFPSNGGGTALAIIGGKLLGDVIRNREPLARYEERARALFMEPLRRSMRARRRIDAVSWSDRLLAASMRLADRTGWQAFVVG